ncbi:MAG TPA: YbjQ family protein [Thermoanaerobaculia bacterium]|nr:YbjQ family protein [Thermoanaerobaculia bacterium]
MILSTTEEVPGRRVARVLGLVRGNTIRTRHVGKDIMAVLRGLVGGEVSEYTKLFAEAREQALDRMVEEAEELGGNAVIGVRFSTSMVMTSAAELLAYGTAVVLAGSSPPDAAEGAE